MLCVAENLWVLNFFRDILLNAIQATIFGHLLPLSHVRTNNLFAPLHKAKSGLRHKWLVKAKNEGIMLLRPATASGGIDVHKVFTKKGVGCGAAGFRIKQIALCNQHIQQAGIAIAVLLL